MTFWDFCAPFYDFAMRINGETYGLMLKRIPEFIPRNAAVIEIAAGTGSISLAIADRAANILCTDVSERMLKTAGKKAEKLGLKNISFKKLNIFDTGLADASFDIVIAAQVLHLIDAPEKAAAELRRIAERTVLMPVALTKNLSGAARRKINIFKFFGFAPKIELDTADYKRFLNRIGFSGCEFLPIDGAMPMTIAIWNK
jgi:ubiquinone/menaquinone biosynthesis C-methylase UbiE